MGYHVGMDIAAIITDINITRCGRTLGAWMLSLPGSQHTLRAYTRNVEQFCVWLDGHGLDLHSVERVNMCLLHG